MAGNFMTDLPDQAHLVEAVVQADDAVLWHGMPNQGHQPRRRHGQRAFVRAPRQILGQLPRDVRKVPAPCMNEYSQPEHWNMFVPVCKQDSGQLPCAETSCCLIPKGGPYIE